MNLTATRKRKSKGGLVISKRRFVTSVTVPLLLYELLGLFVLGWAFVLMFFDYSPGRLGGSILGTRRQQPVHWAGSFHRDD